MALSLDITPGLMSSINYPIPWKFSDTSPPAGDYYLEVQLTEKGGPATLGDSEILYFNTDGDAYFNAATKLIQHYGAPDFTFDYAATKLVPSLGESYDIKYRTVNNGTPSSWTQTSTFTNFIQSTPNLRFRPDYEDYYNQESDVNLFRFLTRFYSSVKTHGYPFSVSMAGLNDTDSDFRVKFYNDNTLVGTQVTSLPGSSTEQVCHFKVNEKLTANRAEIYITIEPIFALKSSHVLNIEMRPAPCNPFYIRWINEFGVPDQYMLEVDSYSTLRQENEKVSLNEWFYLSAIGNERPSGFSNKDTVTVGALVEKQTELNGLASLARSRQIQWLQDVTTNSWVNISPVNIDIPQKAINNGAEQVSIEFEFPKIYT